MMPRKARIDAPGALHHVIIKGIERRKIFRSDPAMRVGSIKSHRYKSILCQQDPYLKELVGYIHLNPLRSGLVANMKDLDKYPWCSHGVLMSKTKQEWQNINYVHRLFGDRKREARKRYCHRRSKVDPPELKNGPTSVALGNSITC